MAGAGQFALWHLLESTLFCILLLAMAKVLGVKGSSPWCWVYRVCLLKFAIPTVWLFGQLQAGLMQAKTVDSAVVFGPLQDVAATVATLSSAGESAVRAQFGFLPFEQLLSGLFLLGLAWGIARRLCRGIRFHRCVQDEHAPFRQREARILTTVSSGLARLKGALVESGPGIGLYGLFRPRVLARSAFLESLNDDELATAFRHEVAHKLRRDNLWCAIAEAIACLFWFHPLVWELRKRMRFEMEKACDEQVVSWRPDARGYVNCLLKAAAFSGRDDIPGAVALSESSLKRRIRNVIEYQSIKVSKMKLFFVCIAGCALLFGSFTIAAVADVENGPLRNVSSDDDERAADESAQDRDDDLDRDRIADERAERRMALVERRVKEQVSKLELEKQLLKKELQIAREEIEKMRQRLSLEQRAALEKSSEMRMSALKELDRAAQELSEERQQLDEERERFEDRVEEEEDRYQERREALAREDRRLEEEEENDDRRDARSDDDDSDSKGDDVFDLKDLDKLPRALRQVEPKYPSELKAAGVPGWVTLKWVITNKGKVRNVVVVESSREAFEEPSIAAIMKSKWSPGRIDGKAVNVRVSQRMEFKPPEEESGSRSREF